MESDGLCVDCKSFHGNPDFQNRCSSCWKKFQEKEKEKKQEEERKRIEEEEAKKPKQENKERCWNCNRKCGLNGIECKCGFVYCSKHRLPEQHDCQFDHKQRARELNKQKLEDGQTHISKLEKMDSQTDQDKKK
ncbi:hypothetical protein PPERSA_04706 [Pseudocohnilembus persalinus]|uniref:AN1-type domain-containing protein n=1 Tax=Pseudocohnilembus persalinus TaxID=266149 RepID=A0A0V0R5B9_PSEPJ|nr:hypothetical protein PPERSA_04706 [Pseudocohnilembus persalinus]|eukprot:KRX09400.1 hypothetical protein PPERSA_04706 [Pseudocohnilembus persalinus]